jgi:hypothetical protein
MLARFRPDEEERFVTDLIRFWWSKLIEHQFVNRVQ